MGTFAAAPEAPTAAPPQLTAGTSVTTGGSRHRGVRKVAILLTSLGDRLSAEVLRSLSEEEVHDITREISLLNGVNDTEREDVLNDFVRSSERAPFLSPGGLEYATSVLMSAFGPDAGKRMAERLLKSIGNETPMLDTLRRADPQQLAKIVHREHPQTIALILCHIGVTQAANLLSALPAALRTQVARRMASLDQISPEVINKLAKHICSKLRLVGESNFEACGGVRHVAEVLNRVDVAAGEEILNSIATEDPTLCSTIRQLMFVFDDFLRLSPEVLRSIVGAVDRKTLTLALKGGSPQLKKAFTAIMSSRAAEMLNEDIQALGPVRVKDVQAAQQTIIAEARKLQAQGLFSLHGSQGDEFVD